MTDIKFRSDMSVDLITHTANPDLMVAMAARVSTLGSDSLPTLATDKEEQSGLINFLIKNRHGSPVEHSSFTFLISAPIFVWREIQRHRMASYNEESGRYKQLEAVFYVPDHNRCLVQTGKTGAYTFVQGSEEQEVLVSDIVQYQSTESYYYYLEMLEQGVAKEVARMVLPLNIYSSAYVTMNARGLMNFLSLRTQNENSTFPSFPQREIAMVADQMENIWAAKMPITWTAWNNNGRVCP
jgi:thymidylate synthase (FAD)